MTNLLTRERPNGTGALLGRPFADLWGFDPFRSTGIEIERTEAGYTIEMAVAGFKPDQIEITLEDGILTVSGKNEKRSFSRSFTVPEDVDEEKIGAHVEHGMLTLTLTLLPKAQPKKIAITAN